MAIIIIIFVVIFLRSYADLMILPLSFFFLPLPKIEVKYPPRRDEGI